MSEAFTAVLSFYVQAFRLFDSNNDGRISTEEFVKLIKKIGGIMTGGQAKALLTLVRIKSVLSLSLRINPRYLGRQGRQREHRV